MVKNPSHRIRFCSIPKRARAASRPRYGHHDKAGIFLLRGVSKNDVRGFFSITPFSLFVTAQTGRGREMGSIGGGVCLQYEVSNDYQDKPPDNLARLVSSWAEVMGNEYSAASKMAVRFRSPNRRTDNNGGGMPTFRLDKANKLLRSFGGRASDWIRLKPQTLSLSYHPGARLRG